MSTKYSRISETLESSVSVPDTYDDEGQNLLSDGTLPRIQQYLTRNLMVILSILNIILFVLSCSLFGVWFHDNYIILNAPFRRLSSYTPIHDRLHLKSEIKRINGTLYPPLIPSIARQITNESESVWQEWENQRVIPVTAAEIRRMGQDPSTAAKLDDEIWGLGDDAYIAVLDVYHQLHCLNTLREIAYGDLYPHISHNPERPLWKFHVDHCVDILMQQLQCSGNVNLVTYHWVETQIYPIPLFSIDRQCIDFEALTHWRLENSIDMDKYVQTIKKPPGVNQLPAADAYYKFIEPNVTNPNHLNGAHPDEYFVQ